MSVFRFAHQTIALFWCVYVRRQDIYFLFRKNIFDFLTSKDTSIEELPTPHIYIHCIIYYMYSDS